MSVVVDHLIVAAHTLAQGVAWCERTLGAVPAPGGRHALMGTHNRLVRLGGAAHAGAAAGVHASAHASASAGAHGSEHAGAAADAHASAAAGADRGAVADGHPDSHRHAYPDAYLEIIAIDPDAPTPGRKRWFGLDEAALQQSLADHGPRLIHFVARSTMLDMHRWGLITVGQRPGDPVAASRETASGLLSWQILVREDGGLDCAGALPTLIHWRSAHPAAALPPSGVALRSLTLHGVPARARDVLRLRGVQVLATAGPALQAVLSTPLGDIHLHSDSTVSKP
ncbi:MAG: VOC family protein [Rubrivivax sp.]|nr:VOC family protein [Rubrivivax sp.]